MRSRPQAIARQTRHDGVDQRNDRIGGSGSPITPVEARNTSRGGSPPVWQPHPPLPAPPITGLAGKGIGVAGIDQKRPRLAVGRWVRHQSTGADGALERVRTPATEVPGSNTASSRSGRPRYFMPLSADPEHNACNRRQMRLGGRRQRRGLDPVSPCHDPPEFSANPLPATYC